MTRIHVANANINHLLLNVIEQHVTILITAGRITKEMSDNENKYNRNDKTQNKDQLENAQEDQEKVGAASSNPETTGPAENLREKAAKAEDKSEGSREAA